MLMFSVDGGVGVKEPKGGEYPEMQTLDLNTEQ